MRFGRYHNMIMTSTTTINMIVVVEIVIINMPINVKRVKELKRKYLGRNHIRIQLYKIKNLRTLCYRMIGTADQPWEELAKHCGYANLGEGA